MAEAGRTLLMKVERSEAHDDVWAKNATIKKTPRSGELQLAEKAEYRGDGGGTRNSLKTSNQSVVRSPRHRQSHLEEPIADRDVNGSKEASSWGESETAAGLGCPLRNSAVTAGDPRFQTR